NEQKLHHLEEALPEAPPATAIAAVRNAYTRRVTKQQEQAEQELFKTVKAYHACKQEDGQSVSTYVLKMKSYLDQMDCLGYPMPLVLGVNMILTSLSKDYDQFVQNYNMHGMRKTIPKLHAMLKLAEKCIPKKTPTVLAIRQDWTLKEELSSIFGKVKEEQSQFIWHIRGAVDWKSSKQSTIAMSSMKAENIAAAEAAMDAIWIRKFISRLGVVPIIDKPMDMYCNNIGAITIADEPGV
nr:hypothetical protein [Tanacetum cinerariifolium]